MVRSIWEYFIRRGRNDPAYPGRRRRTRVKGRHHRPRFMLLWSYLVYRGRYMRYERSLLAYVSHQCICVLTLYARTKAYKMLWFVGATPTRSINMEYILSLAFTVYPPDRSSSARQRLFNLTSIFSSSIVLPRVRAHFLHALHIRHSPRPRTPHILDELGLLIGVVDLRSSTLTGPDASFYLVTTSELCNFFSHRLILQYRKKGWNTKKICYVYPYCSTLEK